MPSLRPTPAFAAAVRTSTGTRSAAGGGPSFAALRSPDFLPYSVTTLLAMMGDNVEHVISYWVIWQAFESPLLAGFAVISHWLPFLLLSVPFGALADRYDCRRITGVGQVLFAGVSLAWGLLFLTGSLQYWHAIVLLILHGVAGAIWTPASQLLLYDMVGPAQLGSAIRLNATARQLGILFAPAVGGALMLAVGPNLGILLNALSYLPLTLWLLSVPFTGHTREALGARLPRRAGRVGPRAALRVVVDLRHNRPVLLMVLLAGLSSLLVGNAFQAQMPRFAEDLGATQSGLGYTALLAATAIGAVVGGLGLEMTGTRPFGPRPALICTLLWALAMIGFALTSSFQAALVLLLLGGIFQIAASSMAQTLVQVRAPIEKRGQVIGVFNMAQLGLRVGSGVSVGVLGSFIGVHWSLAVSAGALLAVTLALFAYGSTGDGPGD